MENWARSLVILGSLCGVACSGGQKEAQSAESGETSSKGRDIEAMFLRETELADAKSIQHPDGRWKARVAAVGPPKLKPEEGFVQLSIPIGTESDVECFLYDSAIDAGQSVAIMLEKIEETVEFQRVAGYRIGAAGKHPAYFMDGRYLVDKDGVKAAGSFKLGVSPRLDTPVLCFHDEPGYRDTFANVMSGLLVSLESAKAQGQRRPEFLEIWAMQLGDVPVGFEHFQVFRNPTGTMTTLTLRSRFVPVGPGELATTDAMSAIESDDTGVLSGRYLEYEGRTAKFDLQLKRSGGTAYAVTGVYQNKELAAEFQSKAGLTDNLSLYRFLQRNRSASKTVTTVDFLPGIDPSAPTESVLVLEKDGPLRIRAGSVEVVSQRDEKGLPSDMELPIGTREVHGTLLLREGAL